MKEFSEYISETKGEYQGKEVDLDNPFRLPQVGSRSLVSMSRMDKGNVVKVTFGDPNLSIKRDHDFRARPTQELPMRDY